MDPTRSILLALAGLAKEYELHRTAELAATRARGKTRARTEALAHHATAKRCLLTALRAADLPAAASGSTT